MSFQDDYKDLESRLRQSKPQTEPLPHAFKRQVRQDLMEQMTMNDNRFSFGKLSMALGGLVILIGIPLLFWLSQMSVGTGNVPGAAPDSSPLDPARPTPTRVRNVAVAQGLDRVWLMSTDIPQGETIGRDDTIFVTVGYELVSVSGQESELIIKLVEGPQELLAVSKTVSGTLGIATFPISLAGLEAPEGDLVTLELNLWVDNPDQGVQKIVYQDFGAGWTVDLTAEPPPTTAEIIHVGKPSPVVEEGLPEGALFEVELTTAYTLSGYEDALLVVGYDYEDANGSAGGYDVHAIQMGSGEISAVLRLDSSLFNAIGEAVEGVNFFARINRYDETAGEWVNLYPGNVALTDGELNLPYPYIRDWFVVHSAAWQENATGQAVLNVTMGYNLESQATADILVNVTGADEVVLGSETAVIEAGQETLTVPIVIDKMVLAGNPIVLVSAVLTAGEIVIEDQQSAVYQSEPTAGETNSQGELWIISTDVVTRTTENGVAADITLVVGYDLSSEYADGLITFSNQYTALENGGSGGGGGSQNQIAPGKGTTEFVFGFETTSWAIARDWLNGLSIYLRLFGNTAAGEEVLIGELYKIGTD